MSNIDTPDDDDILSQDPYERYFDQLLIEEEPKSREVKVNRTLATRDDSSSDQDEDEEDASESMSGAKPRRLSSMEYCEADSTRITADYETTRVEDAYNSVRDQYGTPYDEMDPMNRGRDDDEDDFLDEDDDDDESNGDQSSINRSQLFDKLFDREDAELQPFSKKDELKMIYMRSYLNKRDEEFKEKDEMTLKVRQEIVNCRQRIEVLEKKRDETFDKLSDAQIRNDM